MCDCPKATPCGQPCKKCDTPRTINLALHNKGPKPSMQVNLKCTPPPPPCALDYNTPIKPACIRVISPEEYLVKYGGHRLPKPPLPPIGHGPMVYAIKGAIVLGTIYFTYSEGIWGEQIETMECLRRWSAHMKSFNSRVPPKYDECGRVIMKETSDSAIAPVYTIYKAFVTNLFSGIVKFPMVVKCMYLDYLTALENRRIEGNVQRRLKRNKAKAATQK